MIKKKQKIKEINYACCFCERIYPDRKSAKKCFNDHKKIKFKCFLCSKNLKYDTDVSGFWFIKDGVEFQIHAGYGSKWDGKNIKLCICDECIGNYGIKGE